MKFDFIVANPPYQDTSNSANNNKLWHRFLKKFASTEHLTDDGVLGFVCPDSVFNKSVGIGAWFDDKCSTGEFSLKYANVHTTPVFDVGVSTCDFIVQIGVHDSVPAPVLGNPLDDEIIAKILAYGEFIKLTEENKWCTKASTVEDGDVEILYSANKSRKVMKSDIDAGTDERLKLVFPFSSSYKKQFTTTLPTCQFNLVLYVADEDEAARIKSFTLSKLFVFYASKYKRTAGFTPAVKNSMLPKLDSSRFWTNDEVYELFCITDEERRYIEKTLAA